MVKEVKAGLFGTAIHALGPPNLPEGGIPSKPALTSLTSSQGQAMLTVGEACPILQRAGYPQSLNLTLCGTSKGLRALLFFKEGA